jgi:hypothetical protein
VNSAVEPTLFALINAPGNVPRARVELGHGGRSIADGTSKSIGRLTSEDSHQGLFVC